MSRRLLERVGYFILILYNLSQIRIFPIESSGRFLSRKGSCHRVVLPSLAYLPT